MRLVSGKGEGHHLRAALARPWFRRLLGTRLAAQFGDGVFQASLAGAVLFNPDKATTAAAVAASFSVVLLPYSFIGPFAGVLLDRWWRQRVLVLANLFRALCVALVALEISADVNTQLFFLTALTALSVNRFFLAALSASLPHAIDSPELVTANALTTTAGSVATTIGAGLAIGGGALIGSGDSAYAVVAAAAIVPYLASALTARGFPRQALGPEDVARTNRETPRAVLIGLRAGGRHIVSHPPVARALTMMSVQRFCYGITAVAALLLYRNYFTDHGVLRAGLAGLGQIVGLIAVGSALAALVTPAATRRLGFVRWPVVLLMLGAVAQLVFALPFRQPLMLVLALLLGFVAQGLKICVDTQVQQQVSDEFRGRVFSLYDTMFNLTFVAAALFTALALPADGHSPVAVICLGITYVVSALLYLRAGSRGRHQPAPYELVAA